jgi:hypothetical protein
MVSRYQRSSSTNGKKHSLNEMYGTVFYFLLRRLPTSIPETELATDQQFKLLQAEILFPFKNISHVPSVIDMWNSYYCVNSLVLPRVYLTSENFFSPQNRP